MLDRISYIAEKLCIAIYLRHQWVLLSACYAILTLAGRVLCGPPIKRWQGIQASRET